MTIDPTHPDRPVLIVPFVWIGDFVRCHSVVRLLKAEAPDRPVDMVSSTLCAPLADYMPGVRQAVISDQPRKRLGWAVQRELAVRLRRNGYGQALIMSRKWKAALAPAMAGIPIRTGFAGEARFGLLNDIRWGEHLLPRMIDQMGALALPKGSPLPAEWPLPELKVPAGELARWRELRGLAGEPRPIITLSPGAVGAGKAWPPEYYAALAKVLAADAASVWVLGGPAEKDTARLIAETAGPRVRDLTGNDLRNAVLALAAADVSVTNDSGLMHVSAALGAPTVAIFGPTSPWHWKPLNPVAAILEPPGDQARQQARLIGNEAVAQRPTAGVSVDSVLAAVRKVLSEGGSTR
ncbi:lipopolysaccharide heptosyltransferase II [Pseudolabrys sp. Root1462]|uniref:lipopolysaccharide heptosyltransferase II n=1 Tax=Pseudolabrys sp. Root1462 TaxID=1736466 RepID=UPI00070387EA|nr:lipopolysaccharide heptosyltransferase II [Pseudolabrys sp. Root1462]KQZ00161.1 lipopolysaccharide heptosyltransferase II [Pseudolabrys sp. Root1462]